MNIPAFAIIAILLFAANGYRLGLYKIVAALASFFLAALFAKPLSPVFVWLVLRSHAGPQALAQLSGLLLAGLFLFLLFDLCAECALRKRERSRKQSERTPVALWERIGGAVLGTAWGAFLAVLVLIGFYLIGNVEEVLTQPSPAAPESQATGAAVPPGPALTNEVPAQTPQPANAPKPAEAIFVAIKNQIETSALGGVVRKADPAGERIKGVFRDLKIVASNQDLYEAFTHHPTIARFTKDPRVLALSRDKLIQAQLQNRQYYELLDNPKIAALLTDAALVRELKKLDLGKVLEEVIAKASETAANPTPAAAKEERSVICPNCIGSDGKYKVLYRTEKEALQHSLLARNATGLLQQAYACPFGNGWHLAKPKK